MQMPQRPPIQRPADSRRFTDRVLAELRAAHYSPRGCLHFGTCCGIRSWEQIRLHRRAATEATALHLALIPLARRSPLTLLGSWLLAITHLGLLGPETRSIGLANVLSLARANLPTVAAAPVLAMATDLADGPWARLGTPTAFGAYADALADVVFWTRFGMRSGRWLGCVAFAAWAGPAIGIMIASFVAGRSVDYPRPAWARRLSAALQCLIAVGALRQAGLAEEG
jgi:phosphatidylglycerophosphate synthase